MNQAGDLMIAIDKFKDRSEAALKLASALKYLCIEAPLVLAIPRGAVAMAKIIADELDGELDILLVHKLGHPTQPEYAIGAVNEDGSVFITDQQSTDFIGDEVLAKICGAEVKRLQKKRRMYTPDRGPIEVRGRVCVIIDDGIATGSTLQAAIKTLKERKADRIIVAAPVASRQAMDLLREEGVELCILRVPSNFFSVSSHFEHFEQVRDSAVISMLNKRQKRQRRSSVMLSHPI